MTRWACGLLLVAGPVSGQTEGRPVTASLGVEARTAGFDTAVALRRASQLVVPFEAAARLAPRLVLRVMGSHVVTQLDGDSFAATVEGFTDTHVQVAYAAVPGIAVVSLGASLPTGESRVDPSDLDVVQSIAQNFLPFPISSYGTGVGVTGAVALAQRAGAWNLGLAASARYVGRYTPLLGVDADYAPGVETRLRVATRRPLGERSAVQAGFTFSTFGTDEFTVPAMTSASFAYRPGNRFVGELEVSHQMARSTLALGVWGFVRRGGTFDTAGGAEPDEAIFHASGRWRMLFSDALTLEPGLDVRIGDSSGGSGVRLGGVRVTSAYRVSRGLRIGGGARIERGSVDTPDLGGGDLWGFGGSAFIRVSP